jgi:hypothetical protein
MNKWTSRKLMTNDRSMSGQGEWADLQAPVCIGST